MQARVAAEEPWFLAYDIDPASGSDLLQAKLAADEGQGDAVLVSGNPVVGAALLRRHLHPAYRGVLQFALSVDPANRRQGVGRALAEAALAEARRLGSRRVQLAVVESNRPALALFEAAGFEREGRLRAAAEIDGARHDVIPMAKLLA